jgi:polyhydroxyalkanoate synthase subunit PhaC
MAPNALGRQARRWRNGLAHLAGLDEPVVARTPRDLVWQRETARLWRYRSEDRSVGVPLLLVHSLVSRSYILDLLPENSMVRYLVGEGFDVYLLDWEAPDPADAGNTLETYSGTLIPAAIEAIGADEVTLLGYCYAGVLVLLTAATRPDLPIRNLVTLTTPCDFRQMGFLCDMFLTGRLEAGDVIDDTGLVPARVLDLGFQSIKPTDQVVQQVNLVENLWNDSFVENYLAVSRWAREQMPFPGAAFRQTVDLLVRRNALLEGELPYAGGTARLKDVKMPYLNVYCEQDTIVRVRSPEPLVSLVGSRDASELRLETGHIGLVAGSYAAKVARPGIAGWVRRHSRSTKR